MPDQPPTAPSSRATDVDADTMRRVYEESKTPFKYGVILRHPEKDGLVDCPVVFRFNNRWYMTYVAMAGKVGYETELAVSDDLLKWERLGTILPHAKEGWDAWQADGGMSLIDTTWGGSYAPGQHMGRYWMSYIGGDQHGYEPDPLSIGLAWTETPDKPTPWTRNPENPIMRPSDESSRPFEKKTLYKSTIVRDDAETLQHPFVMFYNAKQDGKQAIERIGCAVSADMLHWSRYGEGPVVEHVGNGISGDPQIVRMTLDGMKKPIWVMHYFGHRWRPKAFDIFACSYDLVHWTKWDGPSLIEPSEPWDKTFAHKPWVIKHDGIVYHFYCAVGDQGRVIAVATSKDMRP
jgi:predicted GH43/DUF377 family glycosyl hydrolase